METIVKDAKVAIFSTTDFAKNLKNVILKYRPDLKIEYFIDSFSEAESFCELPIIRPDSIPQDIDCVLVASKSHRAELVSVLEKNNWKKYKVFDDLFWDCINLYPYKEIFRFVPADHYYSPIPTKEALDSAIKKMNNDVDKQTKAIDFNLSKQLEYLKEFNSLNDLFVFPEECSDKFYYYSKNGFYSKPCALSLMNIIMKNKPKRIIEVGSGYSTAFMADLNNLYFNGEIKISSIEPYPHRLKHLFKGDYEKLDLQILNLQDVPLEFFEQLEENDLLFIDSSHISKADSDVNYIMFEILPRLKKNVIIHFHDIFFPFEYSKKWYDEGRYWNELYIMRAFLSYNKAFSIEFFSSYMSQYVQQKNIKTGLQTNNFGASLYIRKISD